MDSPIPTEAAPDSRCFRLGLDHLTMGIVGMVFFAACGVESTVTAYRNVDGSFPNPVGFAVFFGVGYSCMFLISAWSVVAWRRQRLYLGPTGILHRGVLRNKWLPLNEVTEIQWRQRPASGSVVVRTRSARNTIYFSNYSSDDREEVKWFLRESFPARIQHHPRRLTRKSRIAVEAMAATFFFFFAAFFAFSWTIGRGAECIGAAIANVIGGAWFLYRLRWIRNRQNTDRQDVIEHKSSEGGIPTAGR